MKRILVAEGKQTTHESVAINLRCVGYKVIETENGDRVLELYEWENGIFDAAVLGTMTPGRHDGLAVYRELRQKSGPIDIVLFTARAQGMGKVGGLVMGADDYMTKPLPLSELVAHVSAVYRRVVPAEVRTGSNSHEEIHPGISSLNLHSRALMKENVPIELMQVEFQIMEYFFSNPDKVLDRSDILKHVWRDIYCGEEKIVDVNIRRLRMKIEDEPSNPKHIVIVWGLGCRWEVQESVLQLERYKTDSELPVTVNSF